MKEEGIDLSDKKPQSVFDLFKAGKIFDHVITVGDDFESQTLFKPWRMAVPVAPPIFSME